MDIFESKSISDVVKAKMQADMRDQLKKVATEYVHTNDPWGLALGMKIAGKYGQGDGIAYVTITQGLLVFSLKGCTEQQWVDRVSALSKKDMATPRKVLVKSVALRMNKLCTEIKRQNEFRTKEGRGKPFAVAAGLETQRLVCEYLDLLKSQEGVRHSMVEKHSDDLRNFCRRDDIDDSIIHDAWGFTVAKEVMES